MRIEGLPRDPKDFTRQMFDVTTGVTMKIDTVAARKWMKANNPHSFRLRFKNTVAVFNPTLAVLKRTLRNPEVPTAVKQHVYAWVRYRQRRRRAN